MMCNSTTACCLALRNNLRLTMENKLGILTITIHNKAMEYSPKLVVLTHMQYQHMLV